MFRVLSESANVETVGAIDGKDKIEWKRFDGLVWIQAKQVSKYLNKELKDMFFSLNLIESYGSGIRRAKDALLENGSPELMFYPDNEMDNYTNAVMEVNGEFLKDSDSSNDKKTITKTITKTTTKQEAIIEIIAQNPCISTKELAEQLNITIPGVRYHLTKMKKAGLIRYEGSAKLGQWIIVK